MTKVRDLVRYSKGFELANMLKWATPDELVHRNLPEDTIIVQKIFSNDYSAFRNIYISTDYAKAREVLKRLKEEEVLDFVSYRLVQY